LISRARNEPFRLLFGPRNFADGVTEILPTASKRCDGCG
jgi:hypothetical protein